MSPGIVTMLRTSAPSFSVSENLRPSRAGLFGFTTTTRDTTGEKRIGYLNKITMPCGKFSTVQEIGSPSVSTPYTS